MDLEAAERNRSLFLLAFLASMLSILAVRSDLAPVVRDLVRLGVMLFAMVTTWRFARSIRMGPAGTAVNTVLAAVIMVVPLFVLLRYHRRYVAQASSPATA